MVLETRGQKLVLAGITDRAAPAFGLPGPDMRRALEGAPRNAARIMLAHRPRLVEQSAQENVDLQLSGHTHGGQLFGVNQIVGWFNDGFLAGTYHAGHLSICEPQRRSVDGFLRCSCPRNHGNHAASSGKNG